MTDELSAPLSKPKKKGFALPKLAMPEWRGPEHFPAARVFFGLSLLLIAGFVVRISVVNDPLGGRPVAEVNISNSRNANQVATDVASDEALSQPGSVTPLDAPTDGPMIVAIEDTFESSEPVPSRNIRSLNNFGVIPELTEETQNGPIPHVAPDGRTPFGEYARASVTPDATGGKPLIAVVVTGLGLNESATLEAIEKLPDNVTLAFAPYARTLQRTSAAARAEGHEMLLQIPLEPFDYPDNDPGPQTLLTGQPPRTNFDKLYWLMARMGGYIGVMNHLGARFTSSAADLEPVMEEIGTRGLGYLDDGSSNRSLTEQMARRNRVPFARAHLELDANPSRSVIFEQLEALEAEARDNGSAVGVISALPVSIQALADWAGELEDKGVMLVPASALMRGN